MVQSCSAYGCTERAVKGGPVTFHSFPKDEERKKIWEIKMRRKNFKATTSSKLCSKHFTPDCFDKEKFGGTWLKKTAVPTIFDFPKHLIEKNETRRPLIRKTPEPVEQGMPNDDPKHPDYVPSIFDFKQTPVEDDKKKLKRNKKNIRRGKRDSSNKNSDIDSAHYPRKCPLLKVKSTFRYTAVPLQCPPVTLSENSKEDERKENKTIKSHNFDTERFSKKSGLHQENTLKLSNGDISRKNSSQYLDSDDDDMMCDIEPISLGGNVKNRQPKEITDNESSTDSEEDSELSLQETFFDPSGFSIPTGNPEEFLKRKLESVTELYEKSWKKMKMYQRKCKLYAKQSVALKEVIESLKQINSVPNDL